MKVSPAGKSRQERKHKPLSAILFQNRENVDLNVLNVDDMLECPVGDNVIVLLSLIKMNQAQEHLVRARAGDGQLASKSIKSVQSQSGTFRDLSEDHIGSNLSGWNTGCLAFFREDFDPVNAQRKSDCGIPEALEIV